LVAIQRSDMSTYNSCQTWTDTETAESANCKYRTQYAAINCLRAAIRQMKLSAIAVKSGKCYFKFFVLTLFNVGAYFT